MNGSRRAIAVIAVLVCGTGCLGLPPWISLSENPVHFGRWPLGGISEPRIIVVSNIGDGTTGPVQCTPHGSASFLINCEPCQGQSLRPGDKCELSVTFAPGTFGNIEGDLDVSADPGRHRTLAFDGEGVVAEPYLSTISADRHLGVPADGSSAFNITVTALDTVLKPVSNVQVVLYASGSGNVVTQPTALTDSEGKAHGTVASTVAELKLIGARFPSGPLTLEVPVDFAAAPPDAVLSSVALSDNPVGANGVDAVTVVTTLTDVLGRPVSGQPVVLSATGSGNLLTQPPVSGADGTAIGYLRSTVRETKQVSASSGSVVLAQHPSVTFVTGPASPARSTVIATPSTGIPADGTSASTLRLFVADAGGNPIAGVSPTLTVEGDGATATQPGITDAGGHASASLTSTAPGPKTVTLSVAGIPLYSAQVMFGP